MSGLLALLVGLDRVARLVGTRVLCPAAVRLQSLGRTLRQAGVPGRFRSILLEQERASFSLQVPAEGGDAPMRRPSSSGSVNRRVTMW